MKNLIHLAVIALGISTSADAGWVTPSDNYTIAKLSPTETGASAGIDISAHLTVNNSHTREFFTNGVRDYTFQFNISLFSKRFRPTQAGTYVFSGVTRDVNGVVLETFPALTVNVVEPRPEPLVTVNLPTFSSTEPYTYYIGPAILSGTFTRFGSQIDNATLEVGPSTSYGTSFPLKNGHRPLSWPSDTSVWKVTMVPLPPDTQFHYRISYQTADGLRHSQDFQFQTPPNSPPPQVNRTILLNSSNQAELYLGRDMDGHPLSIVSTSTLQFGTLNGTTYTANPDFPGVETFTITTSDGYDQTTSTVRLGTSEWYRASCVGKFESFLVNDENRPVGKISISVRPDGTFTGKFFNYGAPYSFKGNIAAQVNDWPIGNLEIERFDNPPFTMNVTMNPDPSGNTTIGLYVGIHGDGNYSAMSDWMGPTSAPPEEEIGQTNMLIPAEAEQNPAERPQGTGFGIMKIARKGSVRWVGRTGDNQPFSVGAKYNASGSVHVLARVSRSGNERIYGTLRPEGASSLTWYKPERHSSAYSSGFTSYLQPKGSRFESYGSAETMFDTATEVSPTLAFTAYDHAGAIVTSKNLEPGSKLDSGKESSGRVKLKINRKSGLFTGEISSGGSKPKREKVSGIILPNQRLGSGVWRKSGSDAKVTLSPVSE